MLQSQTSIQLPSKPSASTRVSIVLGSLLVLAGILLNKWSVGQVVLREGQAFALVSLVAVFVAQACLILLGMWLALRRPEFALGVAGRRLALFGLIAAVSLERLELGPSEKAIEDIDRSFRLVKQAARRSRFLVSVTLAMTLLAVAAVAAVVFAVMAETGRREAERQTRLARAGGLVNQADLLRQTQRSELEQSFRLADEAYASSEVAGQPLLSAHRAMQEALELVSQRLGQSWAPLGEGAHLQALRPTGEGLLVVGTRRDADQGRFAVSCDFDARTEHWRSRFEYTVQAYGEFVHISENGRWLATRRNGRVCIWETVSGKLHAELPLDHPDQAWHGPRLVAFAESGSRAAGIVNGKLTIWGLDESPRRRLLVLGEEYASPMCALSATGEPLTSKPSGEHPDPIAPAIVAVDLTGSLQAWGQPRNPLVHDRFRAGTFAVTPDGSRVLLGNGQLVNPGTKPDGSTKLGGVPRGSVMRLNPTASHVALWVPESKPPGPEERLRWVDLRQGNSRELPTRQLGRFRTLDISANGKQVVAWFEHSEQGPTSVSWTPEDNPLAATKSFALRRAASNAEAPFAGHALGRR